MILYRIWSVISDWIMHINCIYEVRMMNQNDHGVMVVVHGLKWPIIQVMHTPNGRWAHVG